MGTKSPQNEIVFVDSIPLLSTSLSQLSNLITESPSLFLDLEGIQLGRHGSISILQLYAPSQRKILIIDVYGLKDKAFTTVDDCGNSLKSILESPIILKGIFDIRNDSDALFSHYGISVDGIRDIQLMELGTRKGSKAFVSGLAKCIEKESTISTEEKIAWQRTKENVRRLFAPEVGGRYELFNERPIKPEILEYCAQDVSLLPGLYSFYQKKLIHPENKFWEAEVQIATRERIKLSQSPGYNGRTRENARGPWSNKYIQKALDEWNEYSWANRFTKIGELEASFSRITILGTR